MARTTQTEQRLEAKITAFKDDPERAALLQHARRFKASWIELAEALSQVQRTERYLTWGYTTFEAYCRKELHIRPETAHKLTGSFGFLERSAPQVLERDGLTAPIPSPEAVAWLARAQESGGPADKLVELSQAVLDQGAPVRQLQRRYGDLFFSDEHPSARRKHQSLADAARRLLELLRRAEDLPEPLCAEVSSALDRLLQVASGSETAPH